VYSLTLFNSDCSASTTRRTEVEFASIPEAHTLPLLSIILTVSLPIGLPLFCLPAV
jgi:hypothetical protein